MAKSYISGRMQLAKRRAKKAGSRLAALTGIFMATATLSMGGSAVLQNVSRYEPDLLKPIQRAEIRIPQKEAVHAIQGHAPIADGDYVQITVPHANAAQTAQQLEALKLNPFSESIAPDKDRLLIPYRHETVDDIVRRVKLVEKETPILLSKNDGIDSFMRYVPRSAMSLEDYCQATHGHIERMPYYDAVRKAARKAMSVWKMGELGHTEHAYMLELYAVIHTESSFNPHTISDQGAQGLMQIMPSTAQWIRGTNAGIFNIEDNIMAGSDSYARFHLFGRNEMNLKTSYSIERTAKRAYNLGPGNVKAGRDSAETRRYVQKVNERLRILNSYFPEVR